ncbi:Arsenite methyltransferase [Flexistipes sinusarabici DSM 4947]|uniref:Arsenite methyltransferase n=1 Tax=Flexistipes sinusarabici (strain ATCC 49648 / DSM 4947 / MAS 10) TaxID=717231 RepID=F8E542_FLESM|nr:Arsenite methyltransferase [Flexistipes sinusarabici DSM 4947]
MKNFDTEEVVKGYYVSTLSSSNDLKTTACCDLDDIPEYVKDISPLIADEIQMKFYGCGSPIPLHLEGCSVVDLGCGTGRDSYIVSKLAGEHGKVLGIDMTNEQIDVARKHINTQMKAFGYENKNVKFVHDYIENAAKYVNPGSADVVISNCVINLTEDKERVLDDIFRMLKNGGELYFSDIYADRRLPDEIRNNELLYAECLGGALYINDFIRLARRAGFNDPRIMTSREIEITNKKVQNLVGNARFYSVKYRLFKIDGLEDACEDYGHVAIYKGGLKYSENKFILDEEHVFEKNKPERVCGNTALMLSESRFRNYFTIIGDFDEHFGAFEDCGGKIQCKEHVDNTDKGCCC